jgi:hypothetical protein
MSEFEKQENTEDDESFPVAIHRLATPGDFTAEDLAFAEELNALFSPEREDLPPYYVQTLLDVDDQRFEPVPREFEHRTSARVFRRLKLRRRIFYTRVSPLRALSMGIGDVSMRRSLFATVGTFVLIMLLTIAFTGSSFAAGVALLLRGTHGSGVYQTNKYPVGLVQSVQYNAQNDSSPKSISLLTAQDQLLFPMYAPGYMLPAYSLAHINLYVGLDQQWANGPMLEFEFRPPPSDVAPKGMGEIWVREFKPRADVLQLVKEGASIPVEMDDSGRALAIYVDGEWDLRNQGGPQWVSGERSELIYQADGVIFWIVGDQRDNVGQPQLMDVARGLAPVPLNQQFRVLGNAVTVTQMSEDIPGPFSTDVIVVYPVDSSDGGGPYYISVSAYQPPKNAH